MLFVASGLSLSRDTFWVNALMDSEVEAWQLSEVEKLLQEGKLEGI